MTNCWPVPLSVHFFPNAGDVNPPLARAFEEIRAREQLQTSGSARFFASDDRLLDRPGLPELARLMEFAVESLKDTVTAANRQVWPEGRMALRLQFAGCWFQIQNRMASHDVHTHGNCSWSGVYCVQIDPALTRHAHPELGELNGATRFYGPYSIWQGGAHMDAGNAYLQKNTIDIAPEPGTLILFPAYVPHCAMPYKGQRDRIIVSFNVQIHAAGSDQLFAYGAR
jgi:uncharacterized protein (TIGR02466 family)